MPMFLGEEMELREDKRLASGYTVSQRQRQAPPLSCKARGSSSISFVLPCGLTQFPPERRAFPYFPGACV